MVGNEVDPRSHSKRHQFDEMCARNATVLAVALGDAKVLELAQPVAKHLTAMLLSTRASKHHFNMHTTCSSSVIDNNRTVASCTSVGCCGVRHVANCREHSQFDAIEQPWRSSVLLTG
jgi:hypothetical protein